MFKKLKKILLSKENIPGYKGLEVLSKEEFNNYISQYSEANYLLRGYENLDINYGLIDPTLRIRNSIAPNGIGDIKHNVMNTYPSWSEYPKRNKSIFMMYTNNFRDIMVPFDELYKVFPLKNSILGYCNSDINNYSWPEIYELYMNFGLGGYTTTPDNFIKDIFGSGITNSEVYLFLWENRSELDEFFIGFLNDFEEFEEFTNNKNKYKIILYIKNKISTEYNNSFSTYLDEILFNPNKNDFKLFNSNNNIVKSLKEGEVWTEAKCLLVNINEL
jgi:hypothetical protein